MAINLAEKRRKEENKKDEIFLCDGLEFLFLISNCLRKKNEEGRIFLFNEKQTQPVELISSQEGACSRIF